MEEIQIDTTPSKSMVSKVLGGPFTFLGQYDDEGIVLMVQRHPVDLDSDELGDLKLSELRELCQERDISLDQMLEKSDLIYALDAWSTRLDPPFNPHVLQPPLHKARVRGDILVLKVAETKEELDSEDNPSGDPIQVLSNHEFFLNYTLEEYIKFASRSDIPEYDIGQSEEEEDEAEESDEANEVVEESGGESPEAENEEEEFSLGEDNHFDDEEKAAMFNLVMNEVLRQYREENGRGPDTKELLDMRAAIAKELGVKVADIDSDQADWTKRADGTPAKPRVKTIGFHNEDKVLEYEPHPDEHTHNFDPDVVRGGDDNGDDNEGESTGDDECTSERPRKRRKTDTPSSAKPDEEEVEDSKPAAKPTALLSASRNATDGDSTRTGSRPISDTSNDPPS
jgi:hypothetical protein